MHLFLFLQNNTNALVQHKKVRPLENRRASRINKGNFFILPYLSKPESIAFTMGKRTNSSKLIGISFPNELHNKLMEKVLATGKSFPWIVRQACIQMLQAAGEDVSMITNSEGRGTRSDVMWRYLESIAKPAKIQFEINPKAIEEALASGTTSKSELKKASTSLSSRPTDDSIHRTIKQSMENSSLSDTPCEPSASMFFTGDDGIRYDASTKIHESLLEKRMRSLKRKNPPAPK